MTAELHSIEAIAEAIARELERRGVMGSLTVTSSHIVLKQGKHQYEAELRTLPRQWPQLKASLRAKRVQELALTLLPKAPASNWWSAAFAVVAASATLGFMLWRVSLPVATIGSGLDPLAAAEERLMRQQRVCENAASRAMRGATLGPADAEGWVVELSIVHPAHHEKLLSNPALTAHFRSVDEQRAFFDESSLLARAPSAASDPDVHLLARELRPLSPDVPVRSYTRFTFSTEHAASYFDPARRIHWVRLAHDLVRSLQASHAALYARCEHQRVHHVGGWFYGATPSHTVAALLWSMLGSSRTPLLMPHLLAAEFDEPATLQTILSAVQARADERVIDKRALALLMAADGGYLEGQPAGPLAARFPVRDSNRAARTALRLGRELELVTTR